MKKLLSLILAASMCMALMSSCGSNGSTPTGGNGSTPAGGNGDASTSGNASGETIKIKFAWGNSRTDLVAAGVEAMAEHIKSASNGTMEMEIYWDNTYCETSEILTQMKKGNLEMGGSGATYISDYMPELGFLNMGYLYESVDHANTVLNGTLGEEIFDSIAIATGQRPLGGYYFGAREVCLTLDKEISTPDDLKGIKMRTNGTESMNFLVSAMGASPMGISYSEMYTALDTGVVDGQENPITTVTGQKLYEVSKSLSYTDHMIDFSWIAASDSFWQSLTADQQQIIKDAVKICCDTNTEATVKAESEAEDLLVSEGLKVYHPDITAIRTAVLAAYDQKAVEDGWDTALMQRVLDAAN